MIVSLALSLRMWFSSNSDGSSGLPSLSRRSGQSISHRRATSESSHSATTSGRDLRTKEMIYGDSLKTEHRKLNTRRSRSCNLIRRKHLDTSQSRHDENLSSTNHSPPKTAEDSTNHHWPGNKVLCPRRSHSVGLTAPLPQHQPRQMIGHPIFSATLAPTACWRAGAVHVLAIRYRFAEIDQGEIPHP